MTKPIKKGVELSLFFTQILNGELKLDASEKQALNNEWAYFDEIKKASQSDQEYHHLMALYYACNNENEIAITFFKKLKGYNNPVYMVNYLTHLIKMGDLDSHITETLSISTQIKHDPDLKSLLANAFLLKGDLNSFRKTANELMDMSAKNAQKYRLLLQDIDLFIKMADLSE